MISVRPSRSLLTTCAVGAVVLGYGISANAYSQSILALVLVYVVAVTGLNLLGGFAGYPNLSQATFMGIGAYSSAYLVNQLGQGFWWSLLVGPIVAAMVAWLIGMPLLRLRGQYFAVASLLSGVVLTTVLQGWSAVGGTLGIGGFVRPTTNPAMWLLLLVVCAAGSVILVNYVSVTTLGKHLIALRQDEGLAESVGIPIARRKMQAFVLGAAIGGLSGVLLAFNAFFISPTSFGFYESFLLFVALVVGGSGRAAGPSIGAVFLIVVPEIFRFAIEARYLFMGIIFIVVMAIWPEGISGALARLTDLITSRIRKQMPPNDRTPVSGSETVNT